MRRAVVFVLAAAITACERAQAPPANAPGNVTSASPASRAGGSSSPEPPKAWDDEIGPVIATPSFDSAMPVMFARDTTGTAEMEVELFTHDDRTSKATLRPGAAVRACAWRRNASITTADGRAAGSSWSLALAPGMATPFSVDGVGDLLPRDSAAMAARISRLVSAIPEDSASAPYRGLPIVVRDAWRFRLADSTEIAVAIAMRSINIESNPRAQAVTLIAEPDASAGPGQWRTAFYERIAGPEDRVEGMDLLAAFTVRGVRPAVALVREGDAGVQVEIVERTSVGNWTVRWSSGTLPCPQP